MALTVKEKIDYQELCRRITPSYLYENIRIGLIRDSCTDNRLHRSTPFDGIIQYLFVHFKNDENDNIGRLMVSDTLLKHYGFDDVNEIWLRAADNTFNETYIAPIGKIIQDVFGDDCIPDDIPSNMMYVVTNKDCILGASAILDTGALEKLADSSNCDRFICIPSSIHEWILIPYRDEEDLDMCSKMVIDVNEECVEEVERLGDRAYAYDIRWEAII